MERGVAETVESQNSCTSNPFNHSMPYTRRYLEPFNRQGDIVNSRQFDGNVGLGHLKIDPNVVRRMILTLVVRNELPLRFVEYDEFRRLMLYVYPDYSPISRDTLLRDIHKVFRREKISIGEAIKNSSGRVSITIGLWTSIANDGYLTLTAHYIDKSWVLHKKLINFSRLAPPHSSANLCEAVHKILFEWGIEERLFSVTVDNASSNDLGSTCLKSILKAKNALPCDGDFFHVRCCAHILNLIVQDGIRLIDTSIQKVRDSIKYVKSSRARNIKFQECCERVGTPTNRGLHGDVTTRWNSTFKMLSDALFYRATFDTLGYLDEGYTFNPSSDEWAKIEKILTLLKPFDEFTKVLSGSKYPTSSLYFPYVVAIYLALNDGSLSDEFTTDMIHAMRQKFNKYWEKCSLVLSFAAVLDPRFKFTILESAFDMIHPGNSSLVDDEIERVKRALEKLYGEYASMKKDQGSSSTLEAVDISPFVQHFLNSMAKQRAMRNEKTELEQYLEVPTVRWALHYDVLAYWNDMESQYPNLAQMARDVLAIPMSTIASESTFSAGGRVIDRYRSKLLPSNVEALVCLRDWIYGVNFGAEPDPDQDTEEISEALRDVFTMFKVPTEVSTTTNTIVVN